MSKYRIIEIKKDGYYKYYQVQEKYSLFFWRDAGFFDTLAKAKVRLKEQSVRQVTTVVHEE